MKRMVKNGNLLDVEPDGSITVAGKPIGGGGEDERILKLIFPYAKNDASSNKKLYIDEDKYNKIRDCYYETIKLYYNDGNPIGVFHVFNFFDSYNQILSDPKNYICISTRQSSSISTWFGSQEVYYAFALLYYSSDSNGKYLYLTQYNYKTLPALEQSKFDALYKLADKPTQDGTYVLKATVSSGAVTYTWVAQ